MSQQTAMQEAIEYLKSLNMEAFAIILEVKFLEKEKEQIMESWKHGNLPTFLGRVLTAEQYYNETYNK